MNYCRKAILLATALFSFSAIHAQLYYGAGFNGYMDGAPYIGFTAIKLTGTGIMPGISLGYEAGTSHFKGSVGYSGSIVKGNGGTVYEPAYSYATGKSDVKIPFDSRNGIFSMVFNFKYYLKDTEEINGSNFFAGLGINTQFYSKEIYNGNYDELLYKTENSFLGPGESTVERGSGFAVAIIGGYQYDFKSGFTLVSSLEYSHKFSGNVLEDRYFDKMNVLTIGIGIKYTYDISNGNVGLRYPVR